MLDLPAMNIRDVVAFMEHLLARKHPFRRQDAGHASAQLLPGDLFAQGLTTTNLSLSVTRTHKPWGARLPRHLSPDEVEAVLASVRVIRMRGPRPHC